MKVIKKLKLNEIYEIDGGYFYIDKKTIEDHINRSYTRYFLKTSVSPNKMMILKAALEGTTSKVKSTNVNNDGGETNED